MKQFHNSIGGITYVDSVTTVDSWALGGRFRDSSNPIMWHYNGSTYALGYANNTLNNEVYIVKQTGFTVTSTQVNNGTDGSEPLNHPTPLLYIDEATGYIYVLQNEFHVDRFGVWKSDNPEDISSFSFIDWFDTNGSYLSLIEWSGSTVVMTTREGESPSGYDFNVLTVDLDNPSGYTDQQVVEMDFATNDVRAYLIPCNYYGSPTTRVYGLQSRDESSTNFYKISLLFSSDQENFENLSGDTTTDVTSTSIAYASLNTNYTVIGSDSDKTVTYAPPNLLQLADDVFLSYRSASDTITINKYSKDSEGVQATFDMPYSYTLSDNEDGYTYLYYDGQKLRGTTKVDDDTCYLFSIETSLTGYSEIKQISVQDGAYIGMPWNMDDVNGLYLMIGRSISGFNGTVPYIITNE